MQLLREAWIIGFLILVVFAFYEMFTEQYIQGNFTDEAISG